MTTTAPKPETTVEPPAVAARRAARLGGTEGVLAADAVQRFIREQLDAADLDGKSVCIVVPDGTRTCPLPLLVGRGARRVARSGHADDDADRPRAPTSRCRSRLSRPTSATRRGASRRPIRA